MPTSTCARCGSFLPETTPAGVVTCEECIEKLFEPGPPSVTNRLAVIGAIVTGLPMIVAIAIEPRLLMVAQLTFSFGATGLAVGLFVGVVIDTIRRRRMRRDRGYDGFAFTAVLEAPALETGYAFAGDRCILFAGAKGTRRVVRPEDLVRSDFAPGSMKLQLAGKARLVVIGKDVEPLRSQLRPWPTTS